MVSVLLNLILLAKCVISLGNAFAYNVLVWL